MKTINLRVRKEIVRCTECKEKNDFFYLSDFTYGERFVFYDGGKKYAYINLIKDEIYHEFSNIVTDIFEKQNEAIPPNLINNIFGIACDPIMSSEVDFRTTKRKCDKCSSSMFENILAEPVEFVNMSFPIITHRNWVGLDPEYKKVSIKNAVSKLFAEESIQGIDLIFKSAVE